jgi:hypothetical protein
MDPDKTMILQHILKIFQGPADQVRHTIVEKKSGKIVFSLAV